MIKIISCHYFQIGYFGGMSAIKQLSVQDLRAKFDKKENFRLVDVRQEDEHKICRIEGSALIPLSQFPARAGELKKGEEIVIHCHHGGRSERACDYLARLGYENVSNLAGGIDAWSLEVDPHVPRY